jgi:hypothetical protein
MIANVSPANSCVEHTLNTLRYADRVKEIKKEGETQTNKKGANKADKLSQELMLARQNHNTNKIKLDQNTLMPKDKSNIMQGLGGINMKGDVPQQQRKLSLYNPQIPQNVPSHPPSGNKMTKQKTMPSSAVNAMMNKAQMRGNSRGQNQFTPSGGGINFYQNQNFSHSPHVQQIVASNLSPQNNQSNFQRSQFVPKQAAGDYLTNLITNTKQFVNSTIESAHG